MAEWISQREFAQRKGVNPSKVTKALANGRIVAHPETRKIDWSTQARAWDEFRDPSKVREHNGPIGQEREESGSTFQKAKIAKEVNRAKLLQLEYDERIRKLLPKDEIKAAIFKFSRAVRDGVQSIPARVAATYSVAFIDLLKPILRKHLDRATADKILAEISAERAAKISHEVWEKEARSVLESLSNGPKIR